MKSKILVLTMLLAIALTLKITVFADDSATTTAATTTVATTTVTIPVTAATTKATCVKAAVAVNAAATTAAIQTHATALSAAVNTKAAGFAAAYDLTGTARTRALLNARVNFKVARNSSRVALGTTERNIVATYKSSIKACGVNVLSAEGMQTAGNAYDSIQL